MPFPFPLHTREKIISCELGELPGPPPDKMNTFFNSPNKELSSTCYTPLIIVYAESMPVGKNRNRPYPNSLHYLRGDHRLLGNYPSKKFWGINYHIYQGDPLHPQISVLASIQMAAKALCGHFLPGMGGAEMQRINQYSLSAYSKLNITLEFRGLSSEHKEKEVQIE